MRVVIGYTTIAETPPIPNAQAQATEKGVSSKPNPLAPL